VLYPFRVHKDCERRSFALPFAPQAYFKGLFSDMIC
jgi:hypothetical protein